MNSPLLPIICYLILSLAVGFWASRKSGDSPEDFYLAGRGLSGFILAASLVATYTSASSFLGGPGVASQLGLSWVYLAMIQVPAAWLTLGVLGKRFAITARRSGCYTVTGFLRARYESNAVAAVASLALLLFFLAAMTAQFVGGARLFQAATGWNYNLSLILFAGTVICYTALGGAKAIALTDLLQGIIMAFGTALLLIVTLKAGGGMSALTDKLAAINPELITPHGVGNAVGWGRLSSFWILVCFGVIGLPHTASRCMSYDNSKAIHRAIIYSTIILSFIMLTVTLCGALSPALVTPKVPDLALPTLAQHLLPPWAVGVFLAGPLAGMMSTLDTQLLQMAGTITQDVTALFGVKPLPPKGLKIITLSLGIIALLLATHPPALLVWLNLFAFGGLESVFFWPLVFGLYWHKGGRNAALGSMILGLVGYGLSQHLPYNIHPIVGGFITSAIGYLVFALFDRKASSRVEQLFFSDPLKGALHETGTNHR